MPWDLARALDLDHDPSRDDGSRPDPGKVTLTQWLAPRRRPHPAASVVPAPAAPVQADGGAVVVDDPFALHLAARRGVGGSGQPLPHLDRLQSAFGHHDLAGVRAHVGGPAADAAAAIGASAYATGDDVAFAAAPDVRQAAHEAAHVVQQRGGVRLDGGVGQAGDVYERHADAVADRVVGGESAEALLDTMAHRGAAGGPAVQRLLSEAQASRFTIVYTRCGSAAVAAAIVAFENRRSPGAFDDSAAREGARAHAPATVPDDPSYTRLHGLRMDDPSYASHGVGSVNPVDPADPSAALTDETAGNETLRAVFIQHRDAEVNRMFQASTADVMAARALAQQAAATVPGAAEVAEAIRARLFTANEYAVVHTLDPARSRRYEPGPGFTACNLYVFDFLRAMGVSEDALPTGSGARDAEGADGAIANATAGAANATAGRFATDPRLQRYWDDLGQDAEVAQREANQGHVVICAGVGTAGAGHYSIVLAENDTRARAHAHRGADGRVDSTLESQAGGGHAADADGVALSLRGVEPEDGELTDFTSNWNYDNRVERTERSRPLREETEEARDLARREHRRGDAARLDGALASAGGDGRSPQWWRHGHDGHFYRYRGGGVGGGTRATTYHLESESSMGMDYDARAGAGAGATVDGDGGTVGDEAAVHAAAAAGVAGAGQALPHVEVIQRSFGHHDVRAVQAHVGGPAADAADAIGARAYATGDRVAFAATPDLRQAAHEAAHVVQQRGGVRLDGGVGRAGDPYERHADEVAARVVRGESAEGLLDTMAHRGAAGGPAVQREAEDRPHLLAAVTAVHEAEELDTAIEALAALHPTRADRAREYPVHLGAAAHVVAGRDVGYVLGQARRRRRSLGSGEWNGRGTPREGNTLCGQRIDGDRRVTVEGVSLRLVQSHGRWGVMYGSNYDAFRAAGERAATAYEAAHQPYRAAAARGATVMHEGGVAAINTYDGMVFTLGPGYAGGRLAHALAPLLDTPAGAALAAVTGHHDVAYMSGLTFNGDARVRLDVVALARMVNVIERHPVDFAEAWIRDVVERDGLAGGNERAGDAAASQTIPEVIGVAEYLHHGYGDYAGTPTSRVAAAVAAHPANPSAQVAHVLRAYAERAARDRTERPDTYRARIESIATLRLPHKVTDFIEAAQARDPSFHFDLAAARAVIPCLTTHVPFTSTTTPPSGLYLDCEVDGVHRYWDYG